MNREMSQLIARKKSANRVVSHITIEILFYFLLQIQSPVNTQYHAQSELGEYEYGYSNPVHSQIKHLF